MPNVFEVGQGPVELLWLRQRQGEISAERALELARAPELTSQLTPSYVQGLSRFCEQAVWRNWQQTLEIQRLLLTAVEAAAESPGLAQMRWDAGITWLGVAVRAVGQVPDGRIFNQAVRVGERLAAEAEAAGDRAQLWLVIHRLGVLHLDPYSAGRSSINYPLQLRLWQERLEDALGLELASLAEDERNLPERARASLATAETYLRRAVSLAEGLEKAYSIKALADALEWRHVLGDELKEAEIVRLSQEGLALLDSHPEEAPADLRGALLAKLEQHAPGGANQDIDPLLRKPLRELAGEIGLGQTVLLGLQDVQQLRHQDPDRGLERVRELRPLVDASGEEEWRVRLWTLEIELLDRDHLLEGEDRPLAQLARKLRRRARQGRWSDERLAAGLIALAALGPRHDEEETALELLADGRRRAPRLADEFDDALVFLEGTLLTGVAVNRFKAGRPAEAAAAVEPYLGSLARFLQLGLPGRALNNLRRLGDLAGRGGPEAAAALVAGLAEHGITAEATIGPAATRLIQEICERAMAAITARGTVKPLLVLLLLHIAKGMRFAAALQARRPYRWQEDAAGRELLDRVAEAAAALPPAPAESDPEKSWLLVGALDPDERTPGETPHQVFENLQRTYDRHFAQQLLAGLSTSIALFPTLEQVQAALDERTVLLSYYLGPGPHGGMAVHILGLTRDDVAFSMPRTDLPTATLAMSFEEHTVRTTTLGFMIGDLLQNLAADPQGPPAAGKATDALASSHALFLAPIGGFLERHRAAGRDHLCIVPHGPLHFFPFHLLGETGRPLADRWIVTYLPDLRLLREDREDGAQARPRRMTGDELVSIGLSFGGELQAAVAEAAAVAALFPGATSLLEEQATETAVSAALQSARYAHLSTHGKHHFTAPAFQLLYLAPDEDAEDAADGDRREGGEGRFHAYEVLALDLSRLELLTLSACETALGGFDAGDNLRGLPASFLFAGVSTLVGTLWAVDADASAMFFTQFYGELGVGASRLDAFAAAQRTTRETFPSYRDWGPFYLIGDWS